MYWTYLYLGDLIVMKVEMMMSIITIIIIIIIIIIES